ncbi:hypothetical protein ACWGTI_13015 [Mesorhizobium sp. ArgA1]
METGDTAALGTNVSVDGKPVDTAGFRHASPEPASGQQAAGHVGPAGANPQFWQLGSPKRKIVPFPANKIISLPAGTEVAERHCETIDHDFLREVFMGRGILLWLLGIPIPIIILIMLFVR